MPQTIQSFAVLKGEDNNSFVLQFETMEGEIFKLVISRDMACDMIPTLFLALDTNKIFRPEGTH